MHIFQYLFVLCLGKKILQGNKKKKRRKSDQDSLTWKFTTETHLPPCIVVPPTHSHDGVSTVDPVDTPSPSVADLFPRRSASSPVSSGHPIIHDGHMHVEQIRPLASNATPNDHFPPSSPSTMHVKPFFWLPNGTPPHYCKRSVMCSLEPCSVPSELPRKTRRWRGHPIGSECGDERVWIAY